jgi:uncharacterized protein YbaR (Trm112 family)
MKPWLLNLLACPIDKHHPLDAYFFKWKTTSDNIKQALSGNEPLDEEELVILAKQVVDGVISQRAVESIVDSSGDKYTEAYLKPVRQAVKGLVALRSSGLDTVRKADSLKVFTRYMTFLEVNTGLLVCPECGRWYPIGSSIDSVPEMLPDDLREAEKDTAWLNEWKEQIPESVLESGKPYNLSTI